jgi:hypothetical protein
MMWHLTSLVVVVAMATQLSPRMAKLVEAVRPVLPFPAASADGDVPADNTAASQWFVVWPSGPDDTRVTVRANPLHPDVQKQGATAMQEINAAIAAAERRAQESYDRALAELRRTGKSTELETITLEDEGVAGERIDAELEATIELAPVGSFELISGVAPAVSAGPGGRWIVSVPANVYRLTTGSDRRDHFRAAETHLFFGLTAKPQVERLGDDPRYRVSVTPADGAFVVWLRGNASLVSTLSTEADWSRLVSP